MVQSTIPLGGMARAAALGRNASDAVEVAVKKHIWYIEALIQTPVLIEVVATDEQDAFAALNDGVWRSVELRQRDWPHAKVKGIGTFTEGPGVNS